MKNKNIIVIISILAIITIIIYSIVKIINDGKKEFYYSDIIVDEERVEEVKEEKKDIIKIHMTGEIVNSGIIELFEGERIADAIEKAGGVTQNADLSKVNLAYPLEDGRKIYIPNFSDSEETEYLFEDGGENVIKNTSKNTSKKVNINNATIDILKTLPGVGDSLAQRILTYKEENGKFKSIEDIKNVSGIGSKKYEELKEHIEVK